MHHRQPSKENIPMTASTTTSSSSSAAAAAAAAATAPYLATFQSYPPSAITDYPTPVSDYLLSSDLSPMENELVYGRSSSAWEIPTSTWTGSRPGMEMLYRPGIPTPGASPFITTGFPCKYPPPESSMTSHDTMLYYYYYYYHYPDYNASSLTSSPYEDKLTISAAIGSSGVGHQHQCRWLKCPLSYTTLDELITHIREDHVGSGKAAYFCFWAGCPRHKRPFTKRHKMHNHMRTHTGERPFSCAIPGCVKRFSRPDSLATHTKTHSNIRPHHCKVPGCAKAYFHSRSLRKHTRSHEQKMTTTTTTTTTAAAAAAAAVGSSSSSSYRDQQQFFPMAELSSLLPL